MLAVLFGLAWWGSWLLGEEVESSEVDYGIYSGPWKPTADVHLADGFYGVVLLACLLGIIGLIISIIMVFLKVKAQVMSSIPKDDFDEKEMSEFST